MDNQHRHIKGYRDLSQQEIDLMNAVKAKAQEVGELVEKLQGFGTSKAETGHTFVDQRWVATGKTDLQKGFMALTRAIAQPTSF